MTKYREMSCGPWKKHKVPTKCIALIKDMYKDEGRLSEHGMTTSDFPIKIELH
jgi:hypothetical protein